MALCNCITSISFSSSSLFYIILLLPLPLCVHIRFVDAAIYALFHFDFFTFSLASLRFASLVEICEFSHDFDFIGECKIRDSTEFHEATSKWHCKMDKIECRFRNNGAKMHLSCQPLMLLCEKHCGSSFSLSFLFWLLQSITPLMTAATQYVILLIVAVRHSSVHAFFHFTK